MLILCVFLSPCDDASSCCCWKRRPLGIFLAGDVLAKQSRAAGKGRSTSLMVGQESLLCYTGPRADPYENGNDPSISIKAGNFLPL